MEELEPNLAATVGGSGVGGGDDYCDPPKVPNLDGSDGDAVNADGYCVLPKEEPEPELCGSDGTAGQVSVCNIGGYYHPTKEEPKLELTAIKDDAVANVSYNCSHCGISLCSQKFKVEHELRCKVHMKQKELESQVTEVYDCDYCRCPFLSKEYKEQHQQKWCRKKPIAKRRDTNDTYFGCNKCEYVTKRKQNLERHLLMHNKNNAEWFACTQCSFKTMHKCAMTMHMKIHCNTFSCCCPICGKSFRRKWYLDDHLLRQHFDESNEVSELITSKIYTCDICNKYRTTIKSCFKGHITLTHHKGVGCQKYQCSRCPYSTFRKCHLKSHSKTHEEQKDYRCTICMKEFTRKQGLDSHVLSNHADNADLMKTITSKIHRCELCSFKAVKLSELKSHGRLKHI